MEPSIQSASPAPHSFESLPQEIRNLIYEHLFGRRTINLVWKSSRRSHKAKVYGFQGVDPSSYWVNWDYTYSFMDANLSQGPLYPGQYPDRNLPLDVFRVSKTIHAEAASVFYSTNDFLFYEPALLRKFVKDFPTCNPLLRRMTLCLWNKWFPYRQYFFQKMVRDCFINMTGLCHVRLFVEVEVKDLSWVVGSDSRLKSAVDSLVYIRRFCGKANLTARFRAMQRSMAIMYCQREKLDLIKGAWEKSLAEISAEAQEQEDTGEAGGRKC